MKYLTTILLAVVALGFAQAQNTAVFAQNLFRSLEAEAVSCSALGFDERDYDFNQCGFISDNLVDVNKRIVERHVREAGLVVVLPWKQDWAGGFRTHTLGFGNMTTMATYVLNYVEIGTNQSFVWLVMNW